MTQLWGGRFAVAPDAAMQALNDSISFDIALYAVDIQGSQAYARALNRAGILTNDEASQIQQGLGQVLAEFQNNTFQLKPGDEDIHTAVERRLAELIGAPAGKLHTGRSRNDQVATDVRLWLRDACQRVQALICELQAAFVTVAEPHLETIMPGYTHFQPAQPITAAHWLMSFFWMLERDRERFTDCYKRVNISPLGQGAISGTPYPLDRALLAADLGFDGVTENSLDGVPDRDGVAEFLFVAALLMTHLSKFAEDVIILANPAFGGIKLPDAYSTGSSLMPQKRNPDPLELTRGKTGRVIGHLTGFLTTLKGLPTGYNKDLQEDKEAMFDTMITLERVLAVLSQMIPALVLVPEKLKAVLEEGLLATELADYLVAKGLPFREAHHLIGALVKTAEQADVPLSQLPLASYQAISPLFTGDVYSWLDFEKAVYKRQATGGTSPVAVQQQIAKARAILAKATSGDNG